MDQNDGSCTKVEIFRKPLICCVCSYQENTNDNSVNFERDKLVKVLSEMFVLAHCQNVRLHVNM